MSRLNSSHSRPQLFWVIEPENKIRFRYLSEGGSHGGLTGKAGNSFKKSYPTLQLRGYHGRKNILVRARLYTEDKKEHVLEFKGKKCEGSKRFLEERLQEDNKVVFKEIKILSKKKDEIEEILMERKQNNLKDDTSDDVRAQLEKRYRKDVKERAKCILNSVRLYFEAFEEGKPHNPICSLFSDVICNQKAASKGDLRICRLSQCAGSWKGNDEVILLCEKVQKDNIKVKFYETNNNGVIIWEDYGIFSPIDVHYQVAISFKTPPYRSNIEKTVNICLERNDETSEPREFTYIPDESSSKKRKLEPYHFNTELSSENMESSESVSSMSVSSPEDAATSVVPASFSSPRNDSDPFDMKDEILLGHDDFLKYFDNFSPDNLLGEGCSLLFENLPDLPNDDDGSDGNYMFYVEDKKIDGTQTFDGYDVIDSPQAPKDIIMNQNSNALQFDGISMNQKSNTVEMNQSLDAVAIDLNNLTLKDNETKPGEFVCDCLKRPLSHLQYKKILRLFLKRDGYGNSLLHIAILLNRNIEPILKISQAAKMRNMLINVKNQKNQTALHLAVEKGRREAVKILLKYGSNPNLKDFYGNNCYHLAAKNNFPEALEEINRFPCFPHEIQDFNDEGLTPMHIAIMQKDPYLFDALKLHIADVNVMEKKAGRSLLHYAVDFQPTLLLKLFEVDGIDVNIQDFEGNTALHSACARQNVEVVYELLHFGADPCIRNFKISLENSKDAFEGQLPSDFTEDKEIVKLLTSKVDEEREKLLNLHNSNDFEDDFEYLLAFKFLPSSICFIESDRPLCQVTERLAEFLAIDMKWKKLVPYYLDSGIEASLNLSPSPAKALLHYIKKNEQDNYLEGLKAVLELVGFKEAVSIINR